MSTHTSMQALREREYFGISGKFHSHVTVKLGEGTRASELERLQAFCRARRVKVTVIDLDNFAGRHQRDIMTTQHYRLDSPGAVPEIIDRLEALSEALEAEGFEVVRVKLEHESLPTLPRFNGANYREIHIKLRLQPERYDDEIAWLREHSATWGYMPSTNPRAIHGDHVVQFVNLRVYEGTLDEIGAQVQALVDALEARGLDVAEVKEETAVFDTNLALDGWWA